jgi:hypothetical protein
MIAMTQVFEDLSLFLSVREVKLYRLRAPQTVFPTDMAIVKFTHRQGVRLNLPKSLYSNARSEIFQDKI